MSCQSNNNRSNDPLACSYTCNIDTLLAKYPHIDFRCVFKTIFDGLRNLEEDCGPNYHNHCNDNCWDTVK